MPAIIADIPIVLEQDSLGNYFLNFSSPDVNRTEIRLASGEVRGTFQYFDSDHVLQNFTYFSGRDGFILRGGRLPVDTATPEPESPELIRARESHIRFLEETRRQRALDFEKVARERNVTEGTRRKREVPVVSVETVPDRIVDAGAVAVAKEEHLADHAARSLLLERNAQLIYAMEVPLPVSDSPEVEEAKQEHFSQHQKFLRYLRGEEEIVPVEGTPVPDSPDVAAAKQEHFEAHRIATASLLLQQATPISIV